MSRFKALEIMRLSDTSEGVNVGTRLLAKDNIVGYGIFKGDKFEVIKVSGDKATLEPYSMNPGAVEDIEMTISEIDQWLEDHTLSIMEHNESLSSNEEVDAIQLVKDLWAKGKSIAEIEKELGVKIEVDGSIPDQHTNIMDGKFSVKMVGESVVTSPAKSLLELASSQLLFNSGGLPLAGRKFIVSSGNTVKVLSQDLKMVKYVNVGKGGTESGEFQYPLKEFDAWVIRELTPTDQWPTNGIQVESFSSDLDLAIKALDNAELAVADALDYGDNHEVTGADIKKINMIKDLYTNIGKLLDKGWDG